MGFSLSKFFGKTETSEDSIEAIIASVEHQAYGVSDSNVLFAGLNELGGYFFFQTIIVGTLNVKCKNGAKLTFKGENFELTLNSDSLEFESHHTEIKGRYVTNIDFQIEESDIKALQEATLSETLLNIKKEQLFFTKYIAP
ncbi:hypothetical protein [Winogradskyella aquimaris]|uniref:Uncharacterized protein n=1 Tax=Winogradskyella aquimaris TaxID=864074 RepID=A0ABU5ELI9_9FLAO|nr:hypothetical protein [Winogradskyella aquimaris]MDY2587143.1 hypothetical protein [Winogradskyella aquimaris]